MENQNKGDGPTHWNPAYPEPGYSTVAEARAFMSSLGRRYAGDSRLCKYCMREYHDA
jgi:hypothetical protein